MAHRSRLRPPGTWTPNSDVLQDEFEAFDDGRYTAVDGDAGGTWAPANPIVVGGNGMSVTGLFDASQVDALTITGGGDGLLVELGNFATFDGTTSFASGSTTDFHGGATVNVDSGVLWHVKSGANLVWDSGSSATFNTTTASFNAGTVGFTGAAVALLNGTLGFTGTVVTVTNTAWAFAGTSAVQVSSTPWTFTSTSSVTRNCPEVRSGNLATTSGRHATAADSPTQTYGAENDRYFYSNLTANRVVTLRQTAGGGNPAPANGTVVRFTCRNAFGFHVTWNNEDASYVANSPTSDPWWIEFEFYSGNWFASAWGSRGGWGAGGGDIA